MRVTQDDFYKRIAKKCDCPNYVAANYVRAVFNEIAGILLNEDSLTIEKFGRFETYRTKARVGTDPNTLEKNIGTATEWRNLALACSWRIG